MWGEVGAGGWARGFAGRRGPGPIEGRKRRRPPHGDGVGGHAAVSGRDGSVLQMHLEEAARTVNEIHQQQHQLSTSMAGIRSETSFQEDAGSKDDDAEANRSSRPNEETVSRPRPPECDERGAGDTATGSYV